MKAYISTPLPYNPWWGRHFQNIICSTLTTTNKVLKLVDRWEGEEIWSVKKIREKERNFVFLSGGF